MSYAEVGQIRALPSFWCKRRGGVRTSLARHIVSIDGEVSENRFDLVFVFSQISLLKPRHQFVGGQMNFPVLSMYPYFGL